MCHTLIRALLCCIALSAIAASEHPQQRVPQDVKKSSPSQTSKVDICKLLTSAEIQTVQGTPVEETKPSSQSGGGLLFQQCLFRTSAPAMSVSIALASPSAQQPRDYWRKQFHSSAGNEDHESAAKEKAKNIPGGKEEEASKPRNIKGLGDEAYWVGGPIAGALYVLHANSFVRISVGGVKDEATRMKRSITLARTVLKRLSK